MRQEGDDRCEGAPSESRHPGLPYGAYLDAARSYEDDGRFQEAVYQLMMAFASAEGDFQGACLSDGHPALAGLRHAWELSCALGDHGLAEHVFEMLEPYLEISEVEQHSRRLEALSMRGLGEMGLSSHDAGEIAEAITKDLIQAALDPSGSSLARLADADADGGREAGNAAGASAREDDDEPLGPGSCRIADLVGFDEEVERLRAMGLGLSGDADDDFVRQMVAQHGIPVPHPLEPLVFRARAREDAARLMLAAAADMGLPTIRMRVDENAFGSTLCVIAANGFDIRAGLAGSGFAGEGVLVLEDYDIWGAPGFGSADRFPEDADYSAVALSKGANRAVALIRSAIADPRISVLASMPLDADASSLLGFGGKADYFDVPDPSYAERCAIWDQLMDEHVSLSSLDRFELVRLTANMPRFDIECAAIEAVEEAFRQSMAARSFVPVRRANVLDKIAAFQPVESDEYREIEDSLVECLRQDIDAYDGQQGRGAL